MANEIRVKTSVEIVQDNDITVQGISYSHKSLDGNAASRSWGGSYTLNTAYTDADVAYWSNVVVAKDDSSGADGIDNSDWTEASNVSDGTLPSTAHVVAVEYVSALGSPGTVTLNVSGENFAVLDEGQAVVIPMEMGEALSSITIKCTDYTNGTNEATVSVMVAGV